MDRHEPEGIIMKWGKWEGTAEDDGGRVAYARNSVLRETRDERVLPRAVLPLSPMLLSLPLQILSICGLPELLEGRAGIA